MKRWAAKGAVFAVLLGAMGVLTAPVAAEPTYACTAETEGHMFLVAYDHPVDPGYYYQCRGGAWRLVGICTPGAGCPPVPDPEGPIVEM